MKKIAVKRAGGKLEKVEPRRVCEWLRTEQEKRGKEGGRMSHITTHQQCSFKKRSETARALRSEVLIELLVWWKLSTPLSTTAAALVANYLYCFVKLTLNKSAPGDLKDLK